MTNAERIIQYLPYYYQESRVMRAIAEVQGSEVEVFWTTLDEILKQFYVETASWGLDMWEKMLNVESSAQDSIEIRRGRIISKLQISFPTTAQKLQNILASAGFINAKIEEMIKQSPRPLYDSTQYHDNGVREAAWWAHYKIKTDLEEWRSFVATDKTEIIAIIEKVAPAHMVLAAIGLILATEDELNLSENIELSHVHGKIQHLLIGNRRWHNGVVRTDSYGPAAEGDAPPKLGLVSRITDRPFGEEGYTPLTHGGERYKHTGSLLRQPLYFYDGSETHIGAIGAGIRRIGWAWYGDCALLHNEAVAYGGPRIHDGTFKHGVSGDGMSLSVRKKRQPVLAA